MDYMVERAYDISQDFMDFANSHENGYCTNWKAVSILMQCAQCPDVFQGERLNKLIHNSLEMEGFLPQDCDAIANWIEANLYQEAVQPVKIRIEHPNNFYNGREGELLHTDTIGGIDVHWISVPCGDDTRIEFALREEHIVRL